MFEDRTSASNSELLLMIKQFLYWQEHGSRSRDKNVDKVCHFIPKLCSPELNPANATEWCFTNIIRAVIVRIHHELFVSEHFFALRILEWSATGSGSSVGAWHRLCLNPETTTRARVIGDEVESDFISLVELYNFWKTKGKFMGTLSVRTVSLRFLPVPERRRSWRKLTCVTRPAVSTVVDSVNNELIFIALARLLNIKVMEQQANSTYILMSLLYPESTIVVCGVLQRIVVTGEVADSFVEAIVADSLRYIATRYWKKHLFSLSSFSGPLRGRTRFLSYLWCLFLSGFQCRMMR